MYAMKYGGTTYAAVPSIVFGLFLFLPRKVLDRVR
jgi:ABC-type phosphate transport system permease subunit